MGRQEGDATKCTADGAGLVYFVCFCAELQLAPRQPTDSQKSGSKAAGVKQEGLPSCA